MSRISSQQSFSMQWIPVIPDCVPGFSHEHTKMAPTDDS